eukprot:2314536-Amphidinium_carterae.1
MHHLWSLTEARVPAPKLASSAPPIVPQGGSTNPNSAKCIEQIGAGSSKVTEDAPMLYPPRIAPPSAWVHS